MNLKEFFTADAIAANWAEVSAAQSPYLGAGLFPPRKKAGLDLTWLKGSGGLPVSLAPSPFDAHAPLRNPIGFDQLEAEMPFFREGFRLTERDRQELLRAANASDPYAQAMMEHIFDGVYDLIAAANVVPERMICQLLFPADGGVVQCRRRGPLPELQNRYGRRPYPHRFRNHYRHYEHQHL